MKTLNSFLNFQILAMKYFGKRSNLKLKNVTIIHSTTAEAIRLFEENNGVSRANLSVNTITNILTAPIIFQMIIHTAVRKKVPLKKKVRSNGKKPSKSSHAPSKHAATPKDSQQPMTVSNKPVPIQTMVTTTPAATSAPQVVPVPVPAKRQKDKKQLKKKRRLSVDESQQGASKSPSTTEVPLVPVKPKKHGKKSKQEVIDYSNRTETHTNTFGKVQKWLMDNPLVPSVTTPVPQINHTAHVSKINKSISTPERLSQRAPSKTNGINNKTKSASNINEKVRLQVVYKPPFKFSLKLSKNEKGVKTQLVGGIRNKTRKSRLDKKRVGVVNETSTAVMAPKRRSAILMCTEALNNTEPAYETLPNKEPLPTYDNIYSASSNINNNPGPHINTATYRINKSASGSNMQQPSSSSTPLTKSATSTGIPNKSQSSSFNKYNKGSVNNLNQLPPNMNPNGHNRRSSLSTTTNLSKQYGGSSQNLMRSSTTNLTKANRNSFHTRPHNYELNRSSTTNLTKDYHRHFSSHANLRRGSSDDLPGGGTGGGRSRKNSTASRHNMSRTPSNSNLKTSRLHGSNSNLPRASVIKQPTPLDIQRQVSLQMKNSTSRPDNYHMNRPHTSSCDDAKHFEWPKSLSLERRVKDEPLPSDLEVMVSDVENIMQDR